MVIFLRYADLAELGLAELGLTESRSTYISTAHACSSMSDWSIKCSLGIIPTLIGKLCNTQGRAQFYSVQRELIGLSIGYTG